MTATTDLSAVASQPAEGKRVRVIPDPDGGSNPSYSIDSLTEPKNGTIKLWEPAQYGIFGRGNSTVTFEGENQSWYVPNRSIQPYNEPGLLIVTEDEGYSAILVISKTVAWHLARRPDGGYRTAVSFNPGEVYAGRWTDLRYLTREGMQALASEIGLYPWEYDVSDLPSGLVPDENQAQDEALVGKAVRLTTNEYASFDCPEGSTMYVAGDDAPVWIGETSRDHILLTPRKDEARSLTRRDHNPDRGVIWVRANAFEVIEEDEAVPTARTAEEIRLAEEVARLNDLVRVERARAYNAESKIEEITDRLIEEANNRGWCSEYDDFAEELGLRPREKEYTATVTLTVEVEVSVFAVDEGSAEERAGTEAEVLLEEVLSGHGASVRGVEQVIASEE